jgi:hypothetical protein
VANKDGDFTCKDAAFIEKWADKNFDIAARAECAEAAGLGTGDMARMNGGRVSKALLQNLKLREALKRRRNIDMDTIADKLADLLDCKSPLNPNASDNYIQHKALETLIRVMDANPPQKIEVDKNTTTQVVITHEAVERMEKYRKMRELDYDESTDSYTERPQEQG